MLKRIVTGLCTALLLAASPALALCGGVNLYDAMSDADRAAIDARAAEVVYSEGLLWEVSRNGQTSTLFGTSHVTDPAVQIPALLGQRIADADRVMLEIVTDDRAEMEAEISSSPQLIMVLEGPGLSEQLTPEDWETLTGSLASMGMPPAAIDRLRPWFAGIMLALPLCELQAAAEGRQTLDARIESLGLASGATVVGLETPEEALMGFLEMSPEDELQFLKFSIATATRPEDTFRTITDLYLQERVQAVWEFSAQRSLTLGDPDAVDEIEEVMRTKLLRDRNLRWMSKLLPALSSGNAVVAVGALHLPGEIGLLRLLEEEGFTVRRLAL
ncbi:MAG: TraB/GumN family protein [Pseudomonadota bacterium]